jgi:DNA (cytosine-5)-methyltransferase 1
MKKTKTTKSIDPKKYKAISLFSGAMGLDLGMEQTGRYDLLACVELEKACCDTIRLNQAEGRLAEHLRVYEGDITNLDPHQVMMDCGIKPGELDVLVGGPPCQAFSTAGKRQSVQDARGTLIWQFLRFVEAMQPKMFLMENVRGLLSASLKHRPIAQRPDKGGPPLDIDEMPGSVVRLFAEDMQRIAAGYHMDIYEVNSVNYGAPQIRERALFIGNRYNAVVDFPDPTHGPVAKQKKRPLGLFDEESKPLLPWRTLRDAIGHLADPGPVGMDFSPRKKQILSMVPEGSNWRSLPEELQKESMGRTWFAKGGRSGWWRRLTFDLPCPTLLTMPNHAGTSLCHPVETRALSIKEYLLIQEFPEDWKIAGTPSQQYKQVGNAVPTRLGFVAGGVIAKQLDELAGRKWKPFDKKPEGYRVIYVQSHVRTRQWFKGGKIMVWEDGDSNGDCFYKPPQTLRKVKELAA